MNQPAQERRLGRSDLAQELREVCHAGVARDAVANVRWKQRPAELAARPPAVS